MEGPEKKVNWQYWNEGVGSCTSSAVSAGGGPEKGLFRVCLGSFAEMACGG